jgi:hypothetical protein
MEIHIYYVICVYRKIHIQNFLKKFNMHACNYILALVVKDDTLGSDQV